MSYRAEIIAVGTELLLGTEANTDAQFLSEQLAAVGVDVLYHESTYPQELAAKAAEHFHSTTVEAAQCALEAGAGKLLLGHYSSRVRDFSIFEREARSVFPASFAAQDGDVIEI